MSYLELLRIISAVDQITDSIWYARGNDYPWYIETYEEVYEIKDPDLIEEGVEEIGVF